MSNQNELALIKKDTVDVVAERVRLFQERGELHFPGNYSPENAMKSAWLILQEIKAKKGEKEYVPVLQHCTKDSIANSLLDMVVQGLNPAKKQGYFIAYGRTLVFQRSYFGTMAVTKDVTNAEDVFAQVVFKGDEFEYEIKRGKKYITKHVQKMANVNKDNILAAYCTIVFDGDKEYTEIMTIDQIKQAWKKSKMNPEKPDSTHKQFTEEMAKKTVINRTCKAYINSSNDSNLKIDHFNRTEEAISEAEVDSEINENANGEVIDIESKPVEESEKEAEQPNQSAGPGF